MVPTSHEDSGSCRSPDFDVEAYFTQTTESQREQLIRQYNAVEQQIEHRVELYEEAESELRWEIGQETDRLETYRDRWTETRETEEAVKDRLDDLYTDLREEQREFQYEVRELEDRRMEVVEQLEELDEMEDVVDRWF